MGKVFGIDCICAITVYGEEKSGWVVGEEGGFEVGLLKGVRERVREESSVR